MDPCGTAAPGGLRANPALEPKSKPNRRPCPRNRRRAPEAAELDFRPADGAGQGRAAESATRRRGQASEAERCTRPGRWRGRTKGFAKMHQPAARTQSLTASRMACVRQWEGFDPQAKLAWNFF